jgi:hypothetical protein
MKWKYIINNNIEFIILIFEFIKYIIRKYIILIFLLYNYIYIYLKKKNKMKYLWNL